MAEVVNLSEFSTDELEALAEKIDKELDHRRKSEIKETAKRMQELAASVGMTIEELLANAPQRRGPGLPRFRNPADPSQTWTGRGKRPYWVHEALEQGKTLDDLRIT